MHRIKIDFIIPYTFVQTKNDSGIRSSILIPIIMAIEKERQNVINLLYFCFGILNNITKLPSIVDSPAIVATISGPRIAFILITSLLNDII